MMAVPSTRAPVVAPVVAMVGGGQLARMTHQAAIALGQTLRVLATAPDEPAAQVTPDVVIGSHTELEDLRRVAAGANVLTFDHEHVPGELLDKLVAEGVNVAPPPQALVHAQDKLVMRRRLEALGAPVPRYAGIESLDELEAFAERIAAPVVVKAVRGGYDGRGVRMARDPLHAREIAAAFLADGVPVMAEEQVNLRRELSALVARSP
ncbi:MAG: 5-(carboxyamino)imidazole ribonucleotide synthase, partial [Mycobacterium sp.]|nr:5-(carboxyamino)imidazole ribonucleotide synthase [Mycobacterium sp.]